MKTRTKNYIKITVLLFIVIAIVLSVKNSLNLNQNDALNNQILSLSKEYTNKDESEAVPQDYNFNNHDTLYNTYDAVKYAKFSGMDISRELDALDAFMKRPINELIDFNSIDFISYVYFYTEICKDAEIKISDTDRDYLIAMIESAYRTGIYYYATPNKFDTSQIQTDNLYATEIAIKSLLNLGFTDFHDETFAFLNDYEVNYVPELEMYQQLMAYKSIADLKERFDINNEQTKEKIKSLLTSNITTITDDFESGQIDIIFVDLIVASCRLVNFELFENQTLIDYFEQMKSDEPSLFVANIYYKNKQLIGF
jgi:hypothetical protein